MATSLRIDIAWTNTSQAAQVLNNPNAQISIGIYHAIHTGTCNVTSGSTDASLVNLTDTYANTCCTALDQGSTGRSRAAASFRTPQTGDSSVVDEEQSWGGYDSLPRGRDTSARSASVTSHFRSTAAADLAYGAGGG